MLTATVALRGADSVAAALTDAVTETEELPAIDCVGSDDALSLTDALLQSDGAADERADGETDVVDCGDGDWRKDGLEL